MARVRQLKLFWLKFLAKSVDYANDRKLLIISGLKMTEKGDNEKKDKDKTGGVTIYFLLAPGKTPDTCTGQVF